MARKDAEAQRKRDSGLSVGYRYREETERIGATVAEAQTSWENGTTNYSNWKKIR
jgi:hypothetical protein